MTLPPDCASPSISPEFHTKCSSSELAITSTSPATDRMWNAAALPPLQAIFRISSKVPSRVERIGPRGPCPPASSDTTLTSVGALRTYTRSRVVLVSNSRALGGARPAPAVDLCARVIEKLLGGAWLGSGLPRNRLKRPVSLGHGEPPEFRLLEATQSELPLQSHDRSLGGLQQRERADERQRQPDQQLKPNGRRVIRLDSEDCRNDGVTDDEDHKIGRKIVGAVMKQFFAAYRTMIGNLQEAAEQFALPAVWTLHRKTPPHGFGGRNRLLRECHDKAP